ncbi:MAG: complex I subunit 1 family protein [Planctomycetota bacterium]|jgi:NADH-quinone oxidoreductase subunit H
MNQLQTLFWLLIFPGFVFTLAVGLIASWIVRKVSALVQYRVGPPLIQPLVDVLKLMGKEVLIPEKANRTVFIAAPLIGFTGVLLLSTMLCRLAIAGDVKFVGDVIVAIYLLVLPSLALILGGSSSASPHASIGTGREMKLVISYELPLLLAFIVVIIKTAGQIEPGQQLSLAAIAGCTPIYSISGAIAFLAALLCVQAKLGYTPFDIAEAETEITGGLLLEYSGSLLAIWKMTQAMMLVALPLFLVMLFMGGFGTTAASLYWGIGKYVIVLVLIILIKNTNPRMRIDQVMKFFWYYCGPVLAAAIILAAIGNSFDIPWL